MDRTRLIQELEACTEIRLLLLECAVAALRANQSEEAVFFQEEVGYYEKQINSIKQTL